MLAQIQWGTVGEWVSGLAGTGALLLGLVILSNDRRHRQSEQARKISVWNHLEEMGWGLDPQSTKGFRYDPSNWRYTLSVENLSDADISQVNLYVKLYTWRQFRAWVRRQKSNGNKVFKEHSRDEFVDEVSRYDDLEFAELAEYPEGALTPPRGKLIYNVTPNMDPDVYDIYITFRDMAGYLWSHRVRDKKLTRIRRRPDSWLHPDYHKYMR